MSTGPADRTTRLGAVVGGLCSLVVVGGALLVAGHEDAPPAACPAIMWGSTVVVTTTGDVDRVDRVEVVPVGADETAPPSDPAGGQVEESMVVGDGVAWESVDDRWSIVWWGGPAGPTGEFTSGRGVVRAWSADDVLLASVDTALRFERTDGGRDRCGGPTEARVALDVPTGVV